MLGKILCTASDMDTAQTMSFQLSNRSMKPIRHCLSKSLTSYTYFSRYYRRRLTSDTIYALIPQPTVKGELNPETNVGLNEYLHDIKFCTGQESVDVVQRKKIFNDKKSLLIYLL